MGEWITELKITRYIGIYRNLYSLPVKVALNPVIITSTQVCLLPKFPFVSSSSNGLVGVFGFVPSLTLTVGTDDFGVFTLCLSEIKIENT